MNTFTLVHVAISLAGILSGFAVVFGLMAGKTCRRWTVFFLATTGATSVTGFFFPFEHFTPALGVGIFSILVLAVTCFARYARQLAGGWRLAYVIGTVLAFYLNFFVLVVQSFLKVPALHALAPTQAEPPFAIAQGITLLVFVGFGVISARRFHPEPILV